MCEKKCDHHDDKKEVYRRILWGVIGIIVIILVVIFLIWVILQPQKPKFILQDATVNALSFSTGTNLLTSNLQLTLSTKNPNERIGIYYEKLDIYASYRNQQISLATQLPRSYEGHKDITVWSPFLYGNSVPVSPYLASAMNQDLNAGAVLVNIKVDGTLKWKVGSWISGRYRINVNCPAYISFGDHNHGVGMKYQFVLDCSVEVAPS